MLREMASAFLVGFAATMGVVAALWVGLLVASVLLNQLVAP